MNNDQQKQEKPYNITFVGDRSVGKSAIIARYTKGIYDKQNRQITIGCEISSGELKMKGETLKLQIFDTAGQEAFHSLPKSYYRESAAIIIVYDVTDQKSFQNVDKWVTEIQENVGDDVVITLVGNKIDLQSQRKISISDGQKKADQIKALFVEVSVKDNQNVADIFQSTMEKVYEIECQRQIELEKNFKKKQITPSQIKLKVESEKNILQRDCWC